MCIRDRFKVAVIQIVIVIILYSENKQLNSFFFYFKLKPVSKAGEYSIYVYNCKIFDCCCHELLSQYVAIVKKINIIAESKQHNPPLYARCKRLYDRMNLWGTHPSGCLKKAHCFSFCLVQTTLDNSNYSTIAYTCLLYTSRCV